VIRDCQSLVFGIDDEYGEQLGRFSIAHVATDWWRFRTAPSFGLGVHLRVRRFGSARKPEGQPEHIDRAGESWYKAPGADHLIAR